LADRRRPNHPDSSVGRANESWKKRKNNQFLIWLVIRQRVPSITRLDHSMNSLTGSEDAYSTLVERGEEGWIHGLVAFAIFEEQRIEWMRHIQSRSGCLPNTEQIREWYEQQPVSALIRARATAKDMLSEHVQAILKVHRDGSNGGKATFALRLNSSQLRSGEMDPSPARSASSRILRDPSKSKAAMVAAELALGPRPKR